MSSRAAWSKALDEDFFSLLFFLMNLLSAQAEVKDVVWAVLQEAWGFPPSFAEDERRVQCRVQGAHT